jgi:hypothetical protein
VVKNCASTVALLSLLALPAMAEGLVDNQGLVLRLIFEDCLGYVRSGARPFAGLALAPLRPEVEAGFPEAALQVLNRYQLLSERYYTYWGEYDGTRLCVISVVDDFADHSPILTVAPDGFLDKVSLRADQEGLTDHALPEVFDMNSTSTWSEPGDDPAELRIVVAPYEPIVDAGLVDMGIIIVAVGIGQPSS